MGGRGRFRQPPNGGYLLIDEVRLANAARAAGVAVPGNLAAMVAAIEAVVEPSELPPLGKALYALILPPHRETLGRAVTAWLNQFLANRIGSEDNFRPLLDLREVSMLEEAVEGWAQQWKRQGIEEGIKEGREEGREEGRVELIERLLIRRFGAPLPAWVRPRLQAAGIAQLDAWAEAIFDARSIEALLGAE